MASHLGAFSVGDDFESEAAPANESATLAVDARAPIVLPTRKSFDTKIVCARVGARRRVQLIRSSVHPFQLCDHLCDHLYDH